jgi:type IV pilus assembly protein PilQ
MKSRLFILLLFFVCNVFATDLATKLEQKVSPRFRGTSIGEVLNLFARQHALNLVVSGEVTGKVSIQMYNVTLADALNSILKSLGYHYIIENEVLLVKSFEREVNGETITKVFNLDYTNAYFLMNTLKPMLSSKGQITPLLVESVEDEKDQRSSVMVVSDLWENVRAIEIAVKKLDVLPKQIQIEIRLIESLLSEEEQYGINLPKRISASFDGAETTAPITKTTAKSSQPRFFSAWYKVSSPANDLSLGVLSIDQLTIALDMLGKDNGSRLISNPRVTTLNNKKAQIKIGTTVPVPEVSRGIAGDLITYKDKEVYIIVDVTPTISSDNKITLDVHPILEEIIGYTGSIEAPQPITSKREVKTVVTVENNQTLVIGGLVRESKTKVVEKIWLLGDIPILGYLFQNTVTKKEKSDLMIFITPKVVDYKKVVKK